MYMYMYMYCILVPMLLSRVLPPMCRYTQKSAKVYTNVQQNWTKV